MATIRVHCPTCRSELELDAQYLGREVECGSCFRPFVIEDEARPPVRAGGAPADAEFRPARRPQSRRDRDDTADEDYDDRPRRRGGYEDEGPPKSRTTYIVLAFFLGGLGVHNFYADRTGPGIAQLVIWLVSWPLMFVFIGCVTVFIPGIWALIDVISVTTDGSGRRMV